ncbi:MAG: phosphoribulokinase [Methanoculleaceae archaeon]
MDPVKNFLQVIRDSPSVFTLGVAGDSGTGKTTFTSAIRKLFGEDLVSTITLDDYHLFDRTERRQMRITPLNPEANRLDQLEEDLAALKAGEAIKKPVYDHTTGRLKPPVTFYPGKIVILEGLHAFATPKLRELLDFTIYVDPVPDVKHYWKILRDVNRRGYTEEEVEAEIRERESDYHRFVEPQREVAEAVITIDWSVFGRDLSEERNIYRVTLAQTPIRYPVEDVYIIFDLYPILSLNDRNFVMEHRIQRRRDGKRLSALTFDGELNSRVISSLERHIEEETHIRPFRFAAGERYVSATQIVQLLLAWRVINRRIFIEEGPGGFW